MRRHDVVKTGASWLKASTSLSVVFAADETHELGHGVAVVPWGPECVFLDQPAWGKDDKVCYGGAGMIGWTGQDGVDGRIRVIKGNASDDREAAQVIFVRVNYIMVSFSLLAEVRCYVAYNYTFVSSGSHRKFHHRGQLTFHATPPHQTAYGPA